MYNEISVIGWMSDNATTGATATGSGFVKFSVGSKKNYPKKENGQDVLDTNGRKVYESSFFNVTVWGKNAEYVAGLNLAKGDLVAVYGSMDLKYYNDANGVRKLSADLNGNKVCLLKKKFQQPSDGSQQPPAGGFQQPPAGGFQQQPAGGFQQQPAGGFQQPPAGGSQQPPAGGSQQPPAGGSQQPPAGGSQQSPAQQQPNNFYSPQQQPAAFGNQQSPVQSPSGSPAGQQQFNQPTNF